MRWNWVTQNLDCDHCNFSEGKCSEKPNINLLFQFWEVILQLVASNKEKKKSYSVEQQKSDLLLFDILNLKPSYTAEIL